MIIGLTGGIGSGKTTVANYLAQLGAEIIDADLIAREIVDIGSPALKEICQTFGPGVLHANGTLNRKKLGSIVFNDQQALKKLNNITHPKINDTIIEKIQHFKSQPASTILVLVAPLLIEVGLHQLVDKVWVIYVNDKVQLQRVIERDNLTKEQARQRINAQLSAQQRLKYADEVIDNSYSIENTRQQVLKLWGKYTRSDTF